MPQASGGTADLHCPLLEQAVVAGRDRHPVVPWVSDVAVGVDHITVPAVISEAGVAHRDLVVGVRDDDRDARETGIAEREDREGGIPATHPGQVVRARRLVRQVVRDLHLLGLAVSELRRQTDGDHRQAGPVGLVEVDRQRPAPRSLRRRVFRLGQRRDTDLIEIVERVALVWPFVGQRHLDRDPDPLLVGIQPEGRVRLEPQAVDDGLGLCGRRGQHHDRGCDRQDGACNGHGGRPRSSARQDCRGSAHSPACPPKDGHAGVSLRPYDRSAPVRSDADTDAKTVPHGHRPRSLSFSLVESRRRFPRQSLIVAPGRNLTGFPQQNLTVDCGAPMSMLRGLDDRGRAPFVSCSSVPAARRMTSRFLRYGRPARRSIHQIRVLAVDLAVKVLGAFRTKNGLSFRHTDFTTRPGSQRTPCASAATFLVRQQVTAALGVVRTRFPEAAR